MIESISLGKLSPERLNNAQPILTPVGDHAWENEVVFNPACFLLEDTKSIQRTAAALALREPDRRNVEEHDAVCVLVYRAQGKETEAEDFRHSRFGIAILTPTLELIYRHPEPIMVPEKEFEDLGVEDARITKIDGRYVMLYAGYSSHPPAGTRHSGENKISICIAFSDDLVHWEKKGPLEGELNEIDNKNGALFPSKIGGSYRILHRPMEGAEPMTVHTAHADSLLGEWTDDGSLMSANDDANFTRSWIGAGGPPLALGENKYISLYHTGHYKPDGTREYDLGLCTIEFRDKPKVIERIERFMVPETVHETVGNRSLGVNNVLFVCAGYLYRDSLYFPYAGADSVVLAARIKLKP